MTAELLFCEYQEAKHMAEDKLSDFVEPGAYLRAADFPDDFEVELQIDTIQGEDIGQGRDKKRQAVAYFTGWPRKYKDFASCGLVLGSKANKNALLDAFGDRFADMEGKKIILYRIWTTFQGEDVPGLRLTDPNATSEKITQPAKAKEPPEDDIPF